MHMRIRAAWLVVAAALVAGCQIDPSYRETKFSSPIFTTDWDVLAQRDRDRPPYIMSYPDDTMFFYPIHDRPLYSDLNLRAIRCSKASDNTLVVSARFTNMGADIIPPREQLYGDFSSFRVLAHVTWSGGGTEDVYGSLRIPMGVSATFNLDLNRTHYFFNDVQAIDVVLDPDQVVPDPVRTNNVLSWRGTMNPDSPSCDVVRS
jgi:hypothetical protein